jgi:hypothetical protein
MRAERILKRFTAVFTTALPGAQTLQGVAVERIDVIIGDDGALRETPELPAEPVPLDSPELALLLGDVQRGALASRDEALAREGQASADARAARTEAADARQQAQVALAKLGEAEAARTATAEQLEETLGRLRTLHAENESLKAKLPVEGR